MAQYIDKDTVVAEIKSLRCTTFSNFDEGVNCAAETLLEIIDTLEVKEIDLVKEVDLEKEMSNYMNNHHLYIKDGGRIVFRSNGDTPNFWCDFRDIAKHFFELGLKTKENKL